jgi:Interleukin-like EMT inducer
MSANGIAQLATKELKQKAKLDLASLDRAASGSARSTYDITLLPTQYNGNVFINNPNGAGLILGRPWIATVPSFTFYEATNTIVALQTTQYVSGNKIYAYSSSLDVPSFQPARVVVNDIEIINTTNRGHTMAVLDSYGDTVSITNYDTYGDLAAVTALASALATVSSGNIVVLVTYDATALNAAVRSALTNNYGATGSSTWASNRVDQIFIGIRV